MIEAMKYLNLGCGKKYSNLPEWINIDFVSSGEHVIAHNLLDGIPYPDQSFDLVYHSHVLEHFSKKDGENFIQECFRVLKKDGVLRIVVPNLEKIAKNYLLFLEEGLEKPNAENNRHKYDWTMIEMYDQTVRNYSGGLMAEYFAQDKIPNEDFVYSRLGQEGKNIRKQMLELKNKSQVELKKTQVYNTIGFLQKIKNKIKSYVTPASQIKINEMNDFEKLGRFRLGGEIHQWMYDRYSLNTLLSAKGFSSFKVKTAFESKIPNWENYQLDSIDSEVRKPDSLFVEVVK